MTFIYKLNFNEVNVCDKTINSEYFDKLKIDTHLYQLLLNGIL